MGVEADRHLAFHCSLGPDVLLARHISGVERLSHCFEYVVTLYSENPTLRGEDLLGQHATVRAKFGPQPERYFDGVVCEFGHSGYAGRYSLYRMVLRPWLWLLSRNRECRVFQHLTTLDIIKQVAKQQWGFSEIDDRLLYALQPREYCVQYRESDFTFLSRLMEEEGIYYYFRHELGRHTLVLGDSISAHETVAGIETVHFKRVEQVDPAQPEGAMLSWASVKRVQAGRVTLQDYDFEKPRVSLEARSSKPSDHEHADAEIFEYPGHYSEVHVGEDRARVRLEEVHSSYETSEGASSTVGLFPGALFTLADHPRDPENRQYLVTSVQYNADSGSFESGAVSHRQFASHIKGIDSAVPFRPARLTHVPLIAGAQTATVVGPKDSEIWTDQYGRVKVAFHWDRKSKRDESSSCWVRVAQSWAGSSWGSIYIPRVGQEVVVEFLEGNPDQPLITGSVYNGKNEPPYKLPQHATQSGIKTQSSKGGHQNDYNELRFEDSKGAEEVVIHAQRNLATTVEHDATETVGHDVKQTVKHDLTVKVAKGTYATTVDEGAMITEVPKNKYELSAKEISELGQDKIELDVGSCQLLIDKLSVTLTAFGSSIKLDASGVTVNGPMIKLNG